jgi:DNA-binding transcriptional ArsR family regulator
MNKPQALAALGALAHETRLDVFRLLVQAGPGGLTAGELAEALDVPGPTLSFHLKELKNAGVLACERDGRERIYAADFAAMNALIAFLTQHCCRGGRRRAAP